MNKLLVLAAMISATNVFAGIDFEMDLAHSEQVLNESKRYEARYVNEDQTVSIVKPMFSNPSGDGAVYLSENSDMNGVCKLYGLNAYVPNSFIHLNVGSAGNSVRLGADSGFALFEANSAVYAIGTITCTQVNQPPIPVSENAKKFTNDDGSTTIKHPKFKMNNADMYLSENSDMNGVCKLYGLNAYVPNSFIHLNVGSTGNSVRLGADSGFALFEANSAVYAIGSIMCR